MVNKGGRPAKDYGLTKDGKTFMFWLEVSHVNALEIQAKKYKSSKAQIVRDLIQKYLIDNAQ